MSRLIYSFAPFIAKSPHLLVLGSMPGEASLQQKRYYAHQRNAFWTIWAQLAGFDKELPYEKKLEALGSAGIALWDVLHDCQRTRSLDKDIKNENPNDIAGFLKQYSSIRAVFLNGGKAAASFRRHVANHLPRAVIIRNLPSTSPANARINVEDKIQIWKKAWDEIQISAR